MSNLKKISSSGTILSGKVNLSKSKKKRGHKSKSGSTLNATSATGSRRSLSSNRSTNSEKIKNYGFERSLSTERSETIIDDKDSKHKRKSKDVISNDDKNALDKIVPQITTKFLDETYCEVLDKFNRLRDHLPKSKNADICMNNCKCRKRQGSIKDQYMTHQNFEEIAGTHRSQYENEELANASSTSVEVKASFTIMRQKPNSRVSSTQTMPSALRSNSTGGRVRYQINDTEHFDNTNISIPCTNGRSTNGGIDHRPLSCCRCICDVCSSHIAQQLFLGRLDQQTLEGLVNRRNSEGRQGVDYYLLGEILEGPSDNQRREQISQPQRAPPINQQDECVLPPHCYQQMRTAPQISDGYRGYARPSFDDRVGIAGRTSRKEAYPFEGASEFGAPSYYRPSTERTTSPKDYQSFQRPSYRPQDALVQQRMQPSMLERFSYPSDVPPPSYPSAPRGVPTTPSYRDEDRIYPIEQVPTSTPSYRGEDRSYPSDRVADIAAPPYQGPAAEAPATPSYRGEDRSHPSEQVADISTPPYQGPAVGVPAAAPYTGEDRSYPSEQVPDISTPYQGPEAGAPAAPPYRGEQVVDIPAPSYQGPVADTAAAPSYRAEDGSYPSEQVVDTPAPSYQDPAAGAQTAPPYRADDRSYPSEQVVDTPAPSYPGPEAGAPAAPPYRTEDRSYPSEQAADIAAPSYQGPGAEAPVAPPYRAEDRSYPSEKAADISAPYQGPAAGAPVAPSYRAEDRSYPIERAADTLPPPYQGPAAAAPTYRGEDRSYPSEQAADISAPYQVPATAAPVTPSYRAEDRSYPSERVADTLPPSYQGPAAGGPAAPSYRAEDRGYQRDRMAEVFPPSYQGPAAGAPPVPSYRAEDRSYPRDQIADVGAPIYQSQPPYGTDSRTMGYTPPAYQSPVPGSTPYRGEDIGYPGRRVSGVPAPSYPPPRPSAPLPYRSEDRSYPRDRIADVPAPAYRSPAPYGADTRTYRPENAMGYAAPTYESPARASIPYRGEDRGYPGQRVPGVSAPSYPPPRPSAPLPYRSEDRNYPRDRIADVSAPAYRSPPPRYSTRQAYPGERGYPAGLPDSAYQRPPPDYGARPAYRADDRNYPQQRPSYIPGPYQKPPPGPAPYRADDRSYPIDRLPDRPAPYQGPPRYQGLPPSPAYRPPYREGIRDEFGPGYQSSLPSATPKSTYITGAKARPGDIKGTAKMGPSERISDLTDSDKKLAARKGISSQLKKKDKTSTDVPTPTGELTAPDSKGRKPARPSISKVPSGRKSSVTATVDHVLKVGSPQMVQKKITSTSRQTSLRCVQVAGHPSADAVSLGQSNIECPTPCPSTRNNWICRPIKIARSCPAVCCDIVSSPCGTEPCGIYPAQCRPS